MLLIPATNTKKTGTWLVFQLNARFKFDKAFYQPNNPQPIIQNTLNILV